MVARIATRMTEIVGSAQVSDVEADRAACGEPLPLLVVWPGAAREVGQVLRACDEAGVGVGIVGGGTRKIKVSRKRWVALVTRRMSDILDIDETSLTVHAQCGVRLRHLASALRRHGMTLGSLPPCLGTSTLGGALSQPLMRAHSPLTGRLEENCMAVSIACLDGRVLHTRVAPRRATGPDLSRLYVGSGGRLGAITTAVMRVNRFWERQLPVVQLYEDVSRAMEAAREFLVHDVRPARLEVLNEARAALELSAGGLSLPGVCVALLAGPEPIVAAQAKLCSRIARDRDGSELSQKIADGWWSEQQRLLDSEAAELPTEDLCAEPRGRLRNIDVHFSDAPKVLAQLPDEAPIRVDNFTPRGARIWVDGDADDLARAFRFVRTRRPARQAELFEQLRRAFDPRGTLLEQERP